jgi:hypothetical protein
LPLVEIPQRIPLKRPHSLKHVDGPSMFTVISWLGVDSSGYNFVLDEVSGEAAEYFVAVFCE